MVLQTLVVYLLTYIEGLSQIRVIWIKTRLPKPGLCAYACMDLGDFSAQKDGWVNKNARSLLLAFTLTYVYVIIYCQTPDLVRRTRS